MVASKSAVAQALSSIKGAANNIDSLTEALDEAKFLEETPGPDRQTYRAARTKLKTLIAAAKAKQAAMADLKNTERSPHMKESYSSTEFETLVDKYEQLNWRLIAKPGGATIRPDDCYQLFALHQQAVKGNNETERPMWAERGGLDFEGRAKWDAWTEVKGMKPEAAKLEFVKTYIFVPSTQTYYEFPPSKLYKDTRATL